MTTNKSFKTNYEKSEEKDLIKFAKEYLLNHYNKSSSKDCGSFYCTRYFGEGCLDECNCGFESYFEIEVWLNSALGADFMKDANMAKVAAGVFLSDKCKFFGREY